MTAKVMECDLVVLGAGGSGLVAAVKASEDGAGKVIVLEKARKAGGSSWFAGGPGVGSMGRMGGSRTGSGGGFSSWFTTKVGEENFVKTARMEKYKDLPDPSIGPGRGGTFLILKMLEFCEKQGVQVLYESPAKKLITDGKGRVTGVLADTGDGELLVNCKACVIAAGGFGRNYEKLKKYWPESYNNKEIFFLCPPGMMGDGIDMAEAIGAHIDQTKWSQSTVGGFFADGPMHHPYSWAVQSLMQGSGMVWINLDGKRWEQGPGSSIGDQPGGVVYSVGDNDIIEAAGANLGSSAGGMGGMMAQMMSDPESNEAKAIKRWKEDLEYEAAIDDEGTHGNHAKKADTLVELALKMDIDPATFVKTIEEYNKAVESGEIKSAGGLAGMAPSGGMPPQGGVPSGTGASGGMQGGPGGDSSGGQGGMPLQGGMPGGTGDMQAEPLKPIRTPPFWAIYGHRFSQCTKGLNGIAVNPDHEILDPRGTVMPGLFAAGDNCTIYGKSGGNPTGGNILSTTPTPCDGAMNAFSSGYSAGVKAAEYLKNNC